MDEDILEKLMLFIYIMTPLIGLSINVIVQILTCRYISKIGLLRSIYFGFFAGFCSIAIMDVLYRAFLPFLFQKMAAANITNMVIYALLGYCYFHFVGLGETARRIRMLTEIYNSKEGLSLKEMLSRYSAAEIMEKRIGRLLSNGQLKYKDGKYFIDKPIVLFITVSVILLKFLFLGRDRESDRGVV